MSRAALGGKPICAHYPHARAWSPVVRIPARSRAVVVAAAQPPAPAARPPCPPPWGRRLPRHRRTVSVSVRSSFVSSVCVCVCVVVVVGCVARRASRAARPHEEQRRAGAGCCELQQRGPNRAASRSAACSNMSSGRRASGTNAGRLACQGASSTP